MDMRKLALKAVAPIAGMEVFLFGRLRLFLRSFLIALVDDESFVHREILIVELEEVDFSLDIQLADGIPIGSNPFLAVTVFVYEGSESINVSISDDFLERFCIPGKSV